MAPILSDRKFYLFCRQSMSILLPIRIHISPRLPGIFSDEREGDLRATDPLFDRELGKDDASHRIQSFGDNFQQGLPKVIIVLPGIRNVVKQLQQKAIPSDLSGAPSRMR